MKTKILAPFLFGLLHFGDHAAHGELLRGKEARQAVRNITARGDGKLVLSSSGASAAAEFTMTASITGPQGNFEFSATRHAGDTILIGRAGKSRLPFAVSRQGWTVFLSALHPGCLEYMPGSESVIFCQHSEAAHGKVEWGLAGIRPDPSLTGPITIDLQSLLDKATKPDQETPATEFEAEISENRVLTTELSADGNTRCLLDPSLPFLIRDMWKSTPDGSEMTLRFDLGSENTKSTTTVTLDKIFATGLPVWTRQSSATAQWKKRAEPAFFEKASSAPFLEALLSPFKASLAAVARPLEQWPKEMLEAAKGLSATLPPPPEFRITAPAATQLAISKKLPQLPATPEHPLPETGDVSVPLAFFQDCPVIEVEVEGRGRQRFLLDTGASDSFITPEASDAWSGGFKQHFTSAVSDRRAVIKAPSTKISPPLSIGDWKVGEASFLVLELPNPLSAGSIVGALGCDILKDHPFTLDAAAQRLVFHQRNGFAPPAGASEIRLSPNSARPVFEIDLEGAGPLQTLLDTGLSDALILTEKFFLQHPKVFAGLRLRDFRTSTPSGSAIGKSLGWPTGRGLKALGQEFTCALDIGILPAHDGEDEPLSSFGAPLTRNLRLTFDLAGKKLWIEHQPAIPLTSRIAAGLDINQTDLGGFSPLCLALRRANLAEAEALFAAGAKLDLDKSREHPMEAAIHGGRMELLEWVAAKDSKGTWKKSGALETALLYNQAEYSDWLLDRGIDLSANPRAMLACAAVGDIRTAARLRKAGLLFDTPPADEGKATGAMALWRHPLGRALVENQPKFLEWAARDSPEAIRQIIEGHRLLSWALYAGRTECVRVLLAAGLDPAGRDINGYTPLHEAAVSGRAELLDLMLTKEDMVNTTTDYEVTPLISAVLRGQAACVRVLLLKKAGLEPGKKSGTTPLFEAVKSLNPESPLPQAERPTGAAIPFAPPPEPDVAACVEALLKAGANPFHKPPGFPYNAAEMIAGSGSGHPGLFALCFPDGIEPAKAPMALKLAADTGDVGMVRFLLDHGYSVEAGEPKSRQSTLALAIWSGRTGVVRELLARNASIAVVLQDGSKPLNRAACFNDAALIEALIKAGADPNAEDAGGDTPLATAIQYRELAAVQSLLARGADPNRRSGILTPVQSAEYLDPKYPEIEKAIKAAAAKR